MNMHVTPIVPKNARTSERSWHGPQLTIFAVRDSSGSRPLNVQRCPTTVISSAQIAAQEDLKQALLDSPALRPIDYTSHSPVIFVVDTSHITIGYHLCQCDADDPKKRYYARFGSITLNEREARFSQPKLKLYGLFRALGVMKLYLIGVRNLVVEVDA